MTTNGHSFPFRQKVGRKHKVWVRISVLGLAALATGFFGCGRDVDREAFGSRSIGRVGGNTHGKPSAGLADPVKRAAHWQRSGYSFDPREISAESMDRYAANFTPSEWLNVLYLARAEVAQNKARRAAIKAQETLEATNAAAARKTQRKNATSDSTRAVPSELPRPIMPSTKPFPPLAQP